MGIFGVWILIALAAWVLLPEELSQWIKLIPIGFIALALILAGIGIFLRHRGYFIPYRAQVNGKTIPNCLSCSESRIKTNPINKNYPIYKCAGKELRVIYNPRSVPGWCPYAVR